MMAWVTSSPSQVASEGCVWPQWVRGGLGGSGVALGLGMGLGFADGLAAFEWPHGLMGGPGGRSWPLGVPVDLRGCRVTHILCQIFTNA
jgi:hypothetical protein